MRSLNISFTSNLRLIHIMLSKELFKVQRTYINRVETKKTKRPFVHKYEIGDLKTTDIYEFTEDLQKQRTKVTYKGTSSIEDEMNDLTTKSTYTTYNRKYPSFNGKPCEHIAFLKIHKAASSTAQNIFFRYGYTRKLTFVLPKVTKNGYPNVISTITSVKSKNIIPPPINKHYDILCCHVIYNRKAFEAIMPKDTAYIGIVREPSEHIRSIIQYFRPKEIYKRFNSTNPISHFFKNPGSSAKSIYSLVNNRMAFEYNFPRRLFYTKDSDGIKRYLRKLASEFHLVIVVEYFDESVVLMRRILNWSIKDILYVTQNESRKEKKTKLSLEDKRNHREWAILEYALYDFFYKRLWDQIKQEGDDFIEELAFFKSLRKEVTEFCRGPRTKNTNFEIPKSQWSDKFIVNNYDCQLLFKRELSFVMSIRREQYGF
ncbi:hypothetical protein KUTeg_019041 [Tegillarca granosa]|uniref:Galactose-3-O-sulfotransferase 3 n=1 Tax=Tegillarca granosa TaxID=220873 RepID=A0ABQ9EBU2_TEGGR|nr:hypothetical protein KUTeg_019041 [Tegillarca granosa]